MTGPQFHGELLHILEAISTAAFVSIDLEMSGITTKPRQINSDRSRDAAKPTLQAVYEDAKAAAELYQVLQLGICPVEQDEDRGIFAILRMKHGH